MNFTSIINTFVLLLNTPLVPDLDAEKPIEIPLKDMSMSPPTSPIRTSFDSTPISTDSTSPVYQWFHAVMARILTDKVAFDREVPSTVFAEGHVHCLLPVDEHDESTSIMLDAFTTLRCVIQPFIAWSYTNSSFDRFFYHRPSHWVHDVSYFIHEGFQSYLLSSPIVPTSFLCILSTYYLLSF